MPEAKNTLDQFLSPESMLTPGAAGALAMMITNALGTNFQLSRGLTALAISFAFGFLVTINNRPKLVKGVYYLINSLIIFCVATGANNVGVKAVTAQNTIVSSAFAEIVDPKKCNSLQLDATSKFKSFNSELSNHADKSKLLSDLEEIQKLQSEAKAIPNCPLNLDTSAALVQKPDAAFAPQKQFFVPW